MNLSISKSKTYFSKASILKFAAISTFLFFQINPQEVLADTLEQLWISYNQIEKLNGIEVMKKLKVLYIGYNLVREWDELSKVAELSENLTDFNFAGNPLDEDMEEEFYRMEVIQRLPFLKMLDGDVVLL